MRIVIELKREANAQVVLNRLFAQTQLQTTFAINMPVSYTHLPAPLRMRLASKFVIAQLGSPFGRAGGAAA